MRLTRDIKEQLKPGDMIEYQSYFSESTEFGIVTAIFKSFVYHKTLDGITKSVSLNKIISFYTREENPEMFL